MLPHERARQWHEHATILRSYGDEPRAAMLDRLADQLENDTCETDGARVDLSEAVELTGYSRGHLRRLLLAGKLRNVGTAAAPKFLVTELPRKPAPRNAMLSSCGDHIAPVVSRLQVARAIVLGE